MTTTSIVSEVDAFVAAQNTKRGTTLPGGGTVSLDYDALTGSVPAGGNAVTGIAGIAANALAIELPAGQTGNAVVIEGGISTTASTSGSDSYSLVVDTTGLVTLTDNNTGNSQTIEGASYLLFNGATTSPILIESGTSAILAAMYNAAFLRVPDLPGLEFYVDQFGTSALPDLHTAADFFLGSPEFKQKYPDLLPSDHGGPNDTAFVTTLYSAILHRAATAAEVNFYVQDLAGTLSLNGQVQAAVDRGTIFEYFTNSPENKADISASSGGWLINPANGVSSFGIPNTQAALSAESAAGTIDVTTIGTVNSSTNVTVTTPSGFAEVIGAGAALPDGGTESLTLVASSIPGEIIYLSRNVNSALMLGTGQTIHGAATGGSDIFVPNNGTTQGGTVQLSGVNNILAANPIPNGNITIPTIVYGFTDGDTISPFIQSNQPASGFLLSGTPSSPINGASLQPFTKVAYGVDLGNVGDGTAAEVVAAANAVYEVGHVSGEAVSFYGTTTAGNTVVYNWFGQFNTANTVMASAFTSAIELMGVTDSHVHASWFQ